MADLYAELIGGLTTVQTTFADAVGDLGFAVVEGHLAISGTPDWLEFVEAPPSNAQNDFVRSYSCSCDCCCGCACGCGCGLCGCECGCGCCCGDCGCACGCGCCYSC